MRFHRGFLLICSITLINSALAASLPKGNCSNPKPFTDLRHCDFKEKDLSGKDLRGTDLRVLELHGLYRTNFEEADLAGAKFDKNKLLHAQIDEAKGLPADIQDVLALYSIIDEKNYLVTRNGNSSITLTPHDSVSGIQENIVGLANLNVIKNDEDKSHSFALFDWPRGNDYKGHIIITRFENGKFDIPSCFKEITLLDTGHYYYADWTSMEVKTTALRGHLIGIRASGSDGDGEGAGGWDMIAFLELSSDCKLTFLKQYDSGWGETYERDRCWGDHTGFRILDEQTAELESTTHTCQTPSKSKPKTEFKKFGFR